MSQVALHLDGLIYAKQAHGGISRNFTNLVNALTRRADVHVTLHLEQGISHPESMSITRDSQIPADPRLRPASLFGRFNARFGAYRRRSYWAKPNSGVFHSTYYSSPEGVRIPQILTMQDTIYEDSPELFSHPRHQQHMADKRKAVQRSTGLIFSSRFAEQATRRHYDIGSRPILVSSYAIDPGFRQEPLEEDIAAFRSRTAGGRPFLLHVGSRYLHKNVSLLLRAYAAWPGRKEFALVLAGGGDLAQDELADIGALGIAGEVVVVPRLGEADLRAAYHGAAAFVFPSLSEGFGFPLLEALACGCPAACSAAASLPEVGGAFPVYFDPNDIDSVRAGLDEVVAARSDRRRWQDAKTMARRRTWGDVAADYVAFYQTVGSTGT